MVLAFRDFGTRYSVQFKEHSKGLFVENHPYRSNRHIFYREVSGLDNELEKKLVKLLLSNEAGSLVIVLVAL